MLTSRPRFSSHGLRSKLAALAFAGAAVLGYAGVAGGSGLSAQAWADPSTTTKDPDNSSPNAAQGLDLSFFRKTSCSAWQIYEAFSKVAPAEYASIKSGAVGSRYQKEVLNKIIRIVGSGQAQSGQLDFNELNDPFFTAFWHKFQPHEAEIAADCPNET